MTEQEKVKEVKELLKKLYPDAINIDVSLDRHGEINVHIHYGEGQF